MQNYSKLNYFCVDISASMLAQCKDKLSFQHNWLIKNKKLHFFNQPVEEISLKSTDKVFFLMFELLDNLPHDKIIIDTHTNLIFQWYIYNDIVMLILMMRKIQDEKYGLHYQTQS